MQNSTLLARLSERGEMLAVAESCTGGQLASIITDVPGSSAIFLGGYVTYANSVKTKTLSVPAELLAEHGAVSAQVAVAMVRGCLVISGADHAIATTGIAGPDGGSEEKPVGTVYIATVSLGDKPTKVVKHHLTGLSRTEFKARVCELALEQLSASLD